MMKFRNILVKEIEREMASIRDCPASEDSYESLLEIEQVIRDEGLKINIEWLKQDVYYSRYRSGLYVPEDEVISVDLGLPSGKRWNILNVGSKSESDPGIYYGLKDIEALEINEIPNNEDFRELRNYTSQVWTQSKTGLFIMSKINSNNFMYIPIAGYYYNTTFENKYKGEIGFLWSSTNNNNQKYGFMFDYYGGESLIKAIQIGGSEKIPIRKIWNLETS